MCSPATNHNSPHFHIVHDDDFQTLTSFKNNFSPKLREVFSIDHYSDDKSLKSPVEVKLENTKMKMKMKVNFKENVSNNIPTETISPSTNNDNDAIRAVPSFLEGDNVVSDGDTSSSEGSDNDIYDENKIETESHSLFAKNEDLKTSSGRKIIKPKRFISTEALTLLSMQSGISIDSS